MKKFKVNMMATDGSDQTFSMHIDAESKMAAFEIAAMGGQILSITEIFEDHEIEDMTKKEIATEMAKILWPGADVQSRAVQGFIEVQMKGKKKELISIFKSAMVHAGR